ncbi:MAG: hypothetical protein WCJ84_00450 [Candidatus Peregrinibacteria bacterium]
MTSEYANVTYEELCALYKELSGNNPIGKKKADLIAEIEVLSGETPAPSESENSTESTGEVLSTTEEKTPEVDTTPTDGDVITPIEGTAPIIPAENTKKKSGKNISVKKYTALVHLKVDGGIEVSIGEEIPDVSAENLEELLEAGLIA